MSSVDTRVVQMQFDNKQFESGIKTSLDSIEQLNKSVKATESTKGMAGLSSAVEAVQVKFSALEVIAATALANITNSAVNAGKKIVSALTIDPVKTGFQEYETQINAIQTILANTESKGTTLDNVNEALDTLNAYADKTIYNFTQMTKNIGTFTAAGIDLETSVNAIQGIANLAAVSGSTSQQASTAMYQLSQALASGTVKLMDWNSVTNAGMGGQVFQEALKETARVHGINIDEMIEKEGSFRETLKNGWLSSEILTDTLQKFTMTTEGLTKAQIEENRAMLKAKGYTDKQIDAIFKLGDTATQAATKVKTFTQLLETTKEAAQSGWTQSWEIIVGDFEESKEMWTSVSNVINGFIGASADARNEMLQTWKELGGRTALLESLSNLFKGIGNVIAPIKEAFREIFPRTTGEQLYKITEGFRGLTESFRKWTENAGNIDKIKRTFKGLFAVLNIGKKLLSAVFTVFKAIFGITGEVSSGFLTITAAIGDFLVALDEAIGKGNVFGFIADKLASGFLFIFEGVKSFVKSVGAAFGLFKDVDMSGVDGFVAELKKRFAPIIKVGEVIWTVLKTIWSIISTIGRLVAKTLKDFGLGIKDAIETGDYDKLLDIVDTALTGGIAAAIISFFTKIKSAVGSGKRFFKDLSDVLDEVKDTFKAYQRDLNAKALLKIAGAIAILAASIIALTFVDEDKLGYALGIIALLLITLFAGIATINKSAGGGMIFKSTGKGMISLGIGVFFLAKALSELVGISWTDLGPALTAVGSLTVVLGAFMVIMAKMGKSSTSINKTGLSIEKSGLQKGALTLVAFAGAIWILVQAIQQFKGVGWDEIDEGVYTVGGLMVLMGTLMTVLGKVGGNGLKKVATGFITFAAAIWILVQVIQQFKDVGWDEIDEGVYTIGALMVLMGTLMTVMGAFNKGGGLTKVATTFIGFAIAIKMLSSAILKFKGISWSEIDEGVYVIGGMMALLTALAILAKKSLKGAAAIAIMSGSLILIAQSLIMVSSIPLEGLLQAGIALGLMLVLLGIVAVAADKSLKGAAAIAIMSASLILIATAFAIVAAIPIDSLGASMLVFIGILAALTAVAVGLSVVAGPVLVGAAALLVLGVALIAIAASIVIFASGITALGVAIKTLASMEWSEFGKGLAMMAAMIVAFIAAAALLTLASPLLFTGAAALAVFGGALLLAGTGLIAVTTGMYGLISVIGLVIGIICNLGENIGEVFSSIGNSFMSFFDSIPQGFLDFGKNIVSGLVNGIKNAASAAWDAIKGLGKMLLDGFKKLFGIHSPSTVFADIGKNLIQGLINGLKSMVSNAWNAIKDFGSKCVEKVKSGLSKFGETAKNAVTNFVSGFKSRASNAWSTVKNYASKCTEMAKIGLSRFGETAKNAATNFVNGFKSKTSGALSTVKNYASKCTEMAKVGLSRFGNTAKTAVSNFANNIKNNHSKAVSAAKNLASKCTSNIKSGISGFASAGKNAIMGFVNGMKNNISSAVSTVKNVGSKVVSGIKNILGIHSPSRVFEEVGMYSDKGLANGLSKFAGVVGKSATNVGKTAIESLKTPMSNISDVLSADMDTEPTIRPVLDLSQVQAGSNQLGNLFGQQTVALAGGNAGIMSGNTAVLADIASQMQKVNDAGNSDIVDAIVNLRRDFNSLSEAVSHMAIVLDSGLLIGQLAPGMDGALGQIAIHKGRSN